MKSKERIWLQIKNEYDGVTWCEDKINDDDVEYVRTDLFSKLEAELETYRERHRDAKSNFATIQRLREENEALRGQNSDLIKRSIAKEEHIHMLMNRMLTGGNNGI